MKYILQGQNVQIFTVILQSQAGLDTVLGKSPTISVIMNGSHMNVSQMLLRNSFIQNNFTQNLKFPKPTSGTI